MSVRLKVIYWAEQNDLSELHTMANWVNPGIFDTYACFKK